MTGSAVTSDVTVVIGCFTLERWNDIRAAIDSALAQEPAPASVIVVVDHNAELSARLKAEEPRVIVLDNTGPRGASSVRNTGAFHATTSTIAFLDDDAKARPAWLSRLIAPLNDPEVVGTGGWVEPEWRGGRPRWFPDEFAWVVGASFAGMPGAGPIRNVWAENMAVRASVFADVGGFREDFGKVGSVSRPEDTDLSIRMSRASGGVWMHVTDAVVDHAVPPPRGQLRYFLRRSYLEGRGKVEMARTLGSASLGSERGYMSSVLPRAVLRGIGQSLSQRSFDGVTRSAAIVLGAAAAGCGVIQAMVTRPAKDSTMTSPIPLTKGA
ncbi:glycosyltransferase [Cryobacterium sp. SO2]|uniref:glycosyltransferase n=1 Tax=Cryobacterium sp. SO2 TaxID=1897060 RepID=UPI00223DA263|nr:glycosyltransferase [Cryobacterium sp. SO2]WEO76159.1 glycosyltransferase [Cryobacterium sp. SO2]